MNRADFLCWNKLLSYLLLVPEASAADSFGKRNARALCACPSCPRRVLPTQRARAVKAKKETVRKVRAAQVQIA